MKTSLPSTSFTLQELIHETLTCFKEDDKYKKLSLHLIDDLVSPLSIKTDKNEFREILKLLIANAVHLVKASKIIISLRQLLKTDNEVLLEFSVEDDGLKKSSDLDTNRFPYKRSLVAVRNRIDDFGGKAEISSIEGVGTTIKFLVKFPWDNTATDSPEKKEIFALAGKKVLVAEDNEINQKIITHLLKKELVIVDVAGDGKEAIELFERADYDLILLDLQMPFMDGFQTANYIRKKMKSTIPIIAMTASAFANEQTRCFEVGINQYLSKPFTPEALYQRLRYLLLNEHVLTNQKPKASASTKDLYSLSALKQTNEEDQVVEILELFIESSPKVLNQIKLDLERANKRSLFKNTAKLKGSLGSLQMQSMMSLVSQLEFLVRADNTNEVPSAVAALLKEHSLVVPLLKTELRELKKKVTAI
ncbi:MAG TPA: response regulator [Chitinophagaceae bacterium]|nr:response regulator [Chitinophagaceae bacterium]